VLLYAKRWGFIEHIRTHTSVTAWSLGPRSVLSNSKEDRALALTWKVRLNHFFFHYAVRLRLLCRYIPEAVPERTHANKSISRTVVLILRLGDFHINLTIDEIRAILDLPSRGVFDNNTFCQHFLALRHCLEGLALVVKICW
jgi:hypothetical protein